MRSIHENDCRELKAKLERIEELRWRGRPAADTIAVSTDLLEGLIGDHEDLDRLLRNHPELRREVPYAG